MAASVVIDAGFLVALLSRHDSHHQWAAQLASEYAPPWQTCDAALSEALYLLGEPGGGALRQALSRRAVIARFSLNDNLTPVLALMEKYRDVPMSLADACLVRMSETLADPLVLTTDSDFLVYRRHSRQVVPSVLPGRAGRRKTVN